MDLFLNEDGNNVWGPQSNSGKEPMAQRYPEPLPCYYPRERRASRIKVDADGEQVEQANFRNQPGTDPSASSRFRSDFVQNFMDYGIGTGSIAHPIIEPMPNSCPPMGPPSLPIMPGRFAPSFSIPAAGGHDMTRSLLNASASEVNAAAGAETVSTQRELAHNGLGWRTNGNTTVAEAPQSAPESSSLVKQLTTKGPDSISLVASPSSRDLFGFFCSDVDQREREDIIRLLFKHCTPIDTVLELTNANPDSTIEHLQTCAEDTLNALHEYCQVTGRDHKSVSVALVPESDFEQLRQDLHNAAWRHAHATSQRHRNDFPLARLTTFWSTEAGMSPGAFGFREVSTADGSRKAFYAPFSVAGPRPELIKVDESEPQAWT